MSKIERFLSVIVVLVLTIAFPAAGLAQGKAVIKPKLSASWQIDDNFYKSETFEREVYTYLVKPGIELGYETAKSMVSFDYTLDAYYYDDQDLLMPGWEPADREDFVGHTGVLEMKTSPTDRLTLGLDAGYKRTRDPASSDRFSNSVDREKYDITRILPSISYHFGERFSAGIKYRHTETDYDLASREDSTEMRPVFDIIYNLNRTMSLDLEYQHWKRDYDLNTSDYKSDQINLIFRREYKYFVFEAGGGYHERNFEDPALEEIDVINFRIGIQGQNPPRPEEKPRSRIALSLERNLNDSGTGDNYYIADSINVGLGYTFMDKFPFDVTASYQRSDYERTFGLTPAGTIDLREDKTFKLKGTIGYIFNDWLLFNISAGHEERDSNLAGRDYDNTFFIAGLEFSYSLGKR